MPHSLSKSLIFLQYLIRVIFAIYMPKWAARIWREITDVRPERLQDITPDDIKAEGVHITYSGTEYWKVSHPHSDFAKLWNRLNAKRGYSWESNPWVWRIESKRYGDDKNTADNQG